MIDGDGDGDDDGDVDGDLPVNDTFNGVVNIELDGKTVTVTTRHRESISHIYGHLRNIVMPNRAASALVSLCTLRISL